MMHLNWKLPRVFYGWWIVVAISLIMLLAGGFIVLGFTAFFEPIVEDLGWSYAQVSLAASLRGVEVGLLAPIIGLLIDRWGPRWLMFGGTLLIGFSLLFLSRITSLGMFYVGFALIAIGFSGCSPTVIMTTVSHWFRKKLGIAIGITSSGFACGGLLVPLVVRLIDVFDWRMALLILGLTTWVINLPLSILLRHKPEQYGYLPDGEKSVVTATDQVLSAAENYKVDIGAKKALRSRTFWHITLSMAFQFLAISAIIVHVMPYLSSIGIPRSTASLVATAIPLVSIAGRLGSGWLLDRFNTKRVAAAFAGVMVLGLLCMNYASSETAWIIIPFIILFGIGWGGNSTTRAAMTSENFGRSSFGSIFGFMMGMIALGSIAGPFFAGWVFDNWASYQIAWLTLSIFAFAATIIVATTPQINTGAQLADKQFS